MAGVYRPVYWNADYAGLFTGPASMHAPQEFDDVTMLIDNDSDGMLDEEFLSDGFNSNSVTLNSDDGNPHTGHGVDRSMFLATLAH